MAAESSHDGTVPSSEETENRPPEWLIDITKEQELQEEPLIEPKEGQEHQTSPETLIEKVNKVLRGIKTNKTHFDPSMVSFGPYHHQKKGLLPMETYKKVAACWFISLVARQPGERITEDDAGEVYKNFIEKVTSLSPKDLSLKDCYQRPYRKYEDEDMKKMMFLDGCFILYFIHLVADKSDRSSGLYKSSSRLNQPLIIRDMFLLENQIPYTVLKALISLTDGLFCESLIIKFIFMVFLPLYESRIGCFRVWFFIMKWIFYVRRIPYADRKHHHLLGLLRTVLIGGSAHPSSPRSGYWYYYFRSIRELKAAGIQVRKSKSILLKDVKFKRGPLNSHLEIPPIIVDDSTKTRLLNLVAYEMCSDGPKDRTVTSYICFLGSLIYNVDDVKELQSKNILLNRLSSNQEVVNLFQELATRLSPDYNAYGDVIEGIDYHFNRNFNRERVRIGEWFGQFIRIHFTSPLTVISLTAAIVLLLLTLLQTIYTMWGFYKTY